MHHRDAEEKPQDAKKGTNLAFYIKRQVRIVPNVPFKLAVDDAADEQLHSGDDR